MKYVSLHFAVALAFAGVLLLPTGTAAQRGITVGQEMPDISLPAIQGGEVSLSDFRGKNVLLIFPRGRVGDHWCQICHYQYAELVELENQRGIRAQHDLDVLFVLPYGEAAVQEWVDIFPAQMDVIEGWKNPEDPDNLSEGARNWMQTARRLFPMQFTYQDGNVPVPFPILVDTGAEISRQLGLFSTNWGGSEVEQNIPTIFLLDREGTVQFKYHSQSTVDRPPYDYLFRVVDQLIEQN